jgi:hypothetical protein
VKTSSMMLMTALSLSLGLSATFVGASAQAAGSKKSAKAKTSASKAKSDEALDANPVAPAKKGNVSRDIRFNGSTVDGKYLSAGESIAEVEGEKNMGALIGIRKNFRDRLASENARLASGKGQ